MTRKKRRFYFIVLVVACLSLAVGLSLYALRDNVAFFYSPADIARFAKTDPARVAAGKIFRLGGLVVAESLKTDAESLRISFAVTDTVDVVNVVYEGVLPDLFREGQGVVARGALDEQGVFHAVELLAKHDENYMPPEVAKALRQGHAEGLRRMQPDQPE